MRTNKQVYNESGEIILAKVGKNIVIDPLAVFRKEHHSEGFVSFASRHIAELEERGKAVDQYLAAVNSLLRFTNGKDVSFAELSTNFIETYDQWLSESGLNRNTASTYLRNLRTLYNRAKSDGLADEDRNPFATVNTKVLKSEKRVDTLTLEELLKIGNYDFSLRPNLDFARDMFMLSIYTHGMTFKDIAKLKKDNVKNGVLTYSTGPKYKQTSITLSQPAKDILEKYAYEDSDWLIPIYNKNEERTSSQVENAALRVRRGLKTISKKLGINKDISVTKARNTWESLIKSPSNLDTLFSAIEPPKGRNNPSDMKSQNGGTEPLPSADVRRRRSWNELFRQYSDFIDKNGKEPGSSENEYYLYSWMRRSRLAMDRGTLRQERMGALKSLLERIKEIEDKEKAATQESRKKKDELWIRQWQEYMDMMEKGNRFPTAANPEDKAIRRWYKINRKRYTSKQLNEGQMDKFGQLIATKAKLKKEQANISKKESNERINKRAAARRLANSPLTNIDTNVEGHSIREVTWNLNYDAYRKFLVEKKSVPRANGSKEERKLYGWISHNRDMLRNGRLSKEHASLFGDLLKLQEGLRNEIRADREKERKKDRNEKEKSRDGYWHKRYVEFMKFLKKGEKGIPAGSTEEQLMQWFYQNLRRMKDGLLNDYRQKLFEALLEKKQAAKTIKTSKGKGRAADTSKAKEKNTIIKRSTSKKPFSPEKRISKYADTATRNGGKRESLWNAKCQTYMDYIAVYHRRPSKRRAGDIVLVNWFNYSWKLMTSGLMKPGRVEKFQQLIDQLEELQQDGANLNENLSHDGKGSACQESHDSKKKKSKKKKARKKKPSPKKTSKWDLTWKMSCRSFEKFLKENKTIPTLKSDAKLYRWFTKQRKLLREGTLSDSRQKAFTKLLGKVAKTKESSKTVAHKGKKTYSIKIKVDRSKPVKQDDMWNAKWQAYLDYMARNKCRPSKHRDEDMVLFDWFKHSWKLMKRGKMKPDRVEKFQQLIDRIEELHPDRTNLNEILFRDGKESVWQESHDSKETIGRETSRKKAGRWDLSWQKSCEDFEKYLEENGAVPPQRSERKLYQWFTRQRKLLREGTLSESRQKAFTALLGKVAEVKKSSETAALKEKTAHHIKIKVDRSKPVKQDDMWNAKWQAYYDYIERNKRRPSKYEKEDMVLVNWFKHSKKLLNQGRMQADRIEKFNSLINLTKNVQRINQFGYVDTATLLEDAKPEKLKGEKKRSYKDSALAKKESISLYDYQQDMKDRIENAFKSHNSVMVQMPTGTGKTHVVSAVVKDYISKNAEGDVWVVAHRRELVKQMRQTLALYLTKAEMKRVLATSIQWLTKHHAEVKEKPILIIIDEAHHAVAKTYASVLNSYPKAKKLGVTATPYRLGGEGFDDLFEMLLTSWNIRAFISKGRLCSYDYYEIDNDSPEMGKIRQLSKRGSDGDYQTKELEQNFNDQLSIQRLYAAYSKYAKGKHGFVYAISIAHAEHIAEFYRSQGVNAIAVSSRTPEKVRDKIMSDFKDGKITVLVSVDLISEGYDAPDAELIQIARPTLSLSKYLQMVGRGLRTAEGKKYCVIIDNVGLADRFGLPDRERDWNRYFKGTDKDGSGLVLGQSQGIFGDVIKGNAGQNGGDMHMAFSHDQMTKELDVINNLRIVENKKGQKGLFDDKGNELLDQTYNNITISPDGIVRASIIHGRVDWFDVANGIIYRKKPILEHIGDMPMAIVDGFFFPRVKSKWITQNTRISNDNMGGLYEAGLKWTNMWREDIEYGQDTYYIPWHGTQKVYKIESDTSFGTRRLVDEEGNMYLQRNPDSEVIPVKDSKEAETIIKSWKSEFDQFEERAKDYPISYVKVSNLPSCGYTLKKGEGSIIEAISPDGKKFWVDNLTRRKFNTKPKPGRKGKAKILLVDDFVFIRNNNQQYPMQYWQIEVDNDGDYWVIGEHQHTKIDVWHRQKTEWWWKKD